MSMKEDEIGQLISTLEGKEGLSAIELALLKATRQPSRDTNVDSDTKQKQLAHAVDSQAKAIRKPHSEYRRKEAEKEAFLILANGLGQRWMTFVEESSANGRVRRDIVRDARPLYGKMQEMDEQDCTRALRELSGGMGINSSLLSPGMRHYLAGKANKHEYQELVHIRDLVPSAAFYILSLEDIFEFAQREKQSLRTFLRKVASENLIMQSKIPLEPLLSRWIGQMTRRPDLPNS